MTRVERKTEVRFAFVTLYNVLFHVIRCTLYFMNKNGTYYSDTWLTNKNIWDAIFVLSLAMLVVVTGIRLLTESKNNHVSAYKTHSAQIRIMMVCILVCEPSNFYAVFLKDKQFSIDAST